MTSPANVLERSKQVADKRTSLPSGGSPAQGAAAIPAEMSHSRLHQKPAPADNSNAASNPGVLGPGVLGPGVLGPGVLGPGVLGTSLQRLYDATGPTLNGPLFSSPAHHKSASG